MGIGDWGEGGGWERISTETSALSGLKQNKLWICFMEVDRFESPIRRGATYVVFGLCNLQYIKCFWMESHKHTQIFLKHD